MSDLGEGIQRDLAAIEAASTIELPGVGKLTRTPLDQAAMKGALLGIAVRLRGSIPGKDRAVLTIAATLVKQGADDPEASGYVARLGLWLLLRRSRRQVVTRTFRVLVAAYNAAQEGRKEWQIRPGHEGKILGNGKLLMPSGEVEVEKSTSASDIEMPTARMFRIAGFEFSAE